MDNFLYVAALFGSIVTGATIFAIVTFKLLGGRFQVDLLRQEVNDLKNLNIHLLQEVKSLKEQPKPTVIATAPVPSPSLMENSESYEDLLMHFLDENLDQKEEKKPSVKKTRSPRKKKAEKQIDDTLEKSYMDDQRFEIVS